MAKELQDFQQRVVEEKQELDDKISRLTTFMQRYDYDDRASSSEHARLTSQLDLMRQYSQILKQRIEAF